SPHGKFLIQLHLSRRDLDRGTSRRRLKARETGHAKRRNWVEIEERTGDGQSNLRILPANRQWRGPEQVGSTRLELLEIAGTADSTARERERCPLARVGAVDTHLREGDQARLGITERTIGEMNGKRGGPVGAANGTTRVIPAARRRRRRR